MVLRMFRESASSDIASACEVARAQRALDLLDQPGPAFLLDLVISSFDELANLDFDSRIFRIDIAQNIPLSDSFCEQTLFFIVPRLGDNRVHQVASFAGQL